VIFDTLEVTFIEHEKIVSFVRGVIDYPCTDVSVFQFIQGIVLVKRTGIGLIKCFRTVGMEFGVIFCENTVDPPEGKIFGNIT
jgi:hypothetical protein